MANDSPVSSNFPEMPQFNLQFLCSLIPRPFDGKRNEFNEFVTNCENAMVLAHVTQKHPLLVFIISKLTGNVRSQLQGKTYNDWTDLKNILNALYQDKKHYIQLMEELNTLKQGHSESVASFHERIDKIVTRLLNSMTYKNENEQIGKIETIKELALSRFIHHSVPDISRFLRSQNLSDMSEAYSKAVLEERALKISLDEFKIKTSTSSNLHCSFCKKSGHTVKNCFKKQNNNSNNVFFNQNQNHSRGNHSSNNFSSNNHNNSNKVCYYCKKRGHLINECRKLQYVNSQRNQNPVSNTQLNDGTRNNNQINLNSCPSQVSAAPVEQDISMA